MNAPLIGQSVKRKEDYRFLTGAGQFTDDVTMAGQTHAYFLRSPHAHAKIRKIDTAAAKAAPGVVAVFTGADMTGVNGLPCGWLITGTDGKPMNEPPHPVLAQGKVRYVGSSNLTGWQLVDADWTARTGGYEAFISAQNEYSWLNPRAETELIPAIEHTGQSLRRIDNKVVVSAWSPTVTSC